MSDIEQFKINACIRILEEEKEECVNPEVKNALNYCILAINKLDEKKSLDIKHGCPHCKFLEDTFHEEIKSNYDYWIVTEVYVYLHDGKDYCNFNKETKKNE